MSDITLTAGIRQNLLSLQQTSSDLTVTQEALATGKAVNSAAANPSAYFTSQNLTNTANSLSSLLDQIGQGLQTIDAANNGLTGLTSLLQQALSTVQQAQSDSWTTAASATGTASLGGTAASTGTAELASFTGGAVTGSATVGTLAAADTLAIDVGTTTYSVSLASGDTISSILTAINGTAGLSGAVSASTSTSGFLVLSAISDTPSFTVAGGSTTLNVASGAVTSTFSNSAATSLSAGTLSILLGTGTYNVTYAADATLATIESSISNTTGLKGIVTATDDGAGHLVLNSTEGFTVAASSGAYALGLTSAATATAGFTLNGAANANAAGNLLINVGSSTYTVSIAASSTLAQIETDVNGTTGLGSAGAVTATDDGLGHLVLTSNQAPTGFTVVANSLSNTLGATTSATANNSPIGSSTTRSTLQGNYGTLLTQVNELANDAGYNGVNLLAGDNLTIDFNQTGSSSLTIQGVNFNALGLGLSSVTGTAAGSFNDNNELTTLVSKLNTALDSVQSQTETFGTNSSTISTRQTFTNAAINTLQTGASNLVAADQNQESADLLTEQTQQQLEISALSIANQANQSVLKLFG
jgi:flagellin